MATDKGEEINIRSLFNQQNVDLDVFIPCLMPKQFPCKRCLDHIIGYVTRQLVFGLSTSLFKDANSAF